jgi:RNA polymerase sigma-70 factor (ECF subfamily)
MPLFDQQPGSAYSAAGRFATTHWSLVVAAQDQTSPQAREALAELCTAYWYPIYAFIRRQGHDADQAQDLTQEFFARLLETDFLGTVDREKGKFRSFLLACCKHFLANEHDRAHAQKRGGDRVLISVDFQVAESRYGLESSHTLTPEKLFERRWALTLLDQALARLREEFALAGRSKLFDSVKIFLTGEKSKQSYGQVAEALHMSEGTIKVTVHRLRRRYRELLRAEIARTLDDPGQVEAEIRELFALFSS